MSTIFRKVMVSDRLPTKNEKYTTDVGDIWFHSHNKYFLSPIEKPTWWL